MDPSALIVGSLVLLGLPWLLRPRGGQAGEVRGLLRPLWWINQAYCGAMHRLAIENDAPLPEVGPAILIANHTCGIDHLVLQAGTRRVLGFMIAQEFFDHRLYHPFCKAIGCIPVKRDGRDQTAIRAALRVLKQGRVLPIFPEGRINPSSGREFHEPKPGAAFIALRAGVPVIPAYIRGTPPTNDIVQSLKTPSRARVVFGPPVDLSDLTDERRDRENLEEASARLMGAIRALREQAVCGASHGEGKGPRGEDRRRP